MFTVELCLRLPVVGTCNEVVTLEHRRNRFEQDVKVSRKRYPLQVFKVELDATTPVDAVAPKDLRPPRDPGANEEAPPLPLVILLDLVCEPWAGSHEAHVTAKDAEQLGNFVETQTPDEATYSGDSSIVSLDQNARSVCFSPNDHRSELAEFKRSPLVTNPHLPIKNWSARVDPNSDGDGKNNRRQDNQNQRTHRDPITLNQSN